MARSTSPAPSSAPSAPSASEQAYQAESDHGTLARAEDIRADPTRVAGVKRHQRKVAKSMTAVTRSLSMGTLRGGSR